MESFLFREGADEIGGIITKGIFTIIEDIINATNEEIHKKAQHLEIDLIKFVSKFAYSPQNQNFERIYVDFDKLAKKDVNDIVKNYTLLTRYKSRLK